MGHLGKIQGDLETFMKIQWNSQENHGTSGFETVIVGVDGPTHQGTLGHPEPLVSNVPYVSMYLPSFLPQLTP